MAKQGQSASDRMALDPVRERFAQQYHATGNASEALRRANPKALNWKAETLHVKASKMLAEDKVRIRLSELQSASAEKHDITIETLTKMLKADRELARERAQSSAAVSAVMGLAKLHGFMVDKTEHGVSDELGELLARIDGAARSKFQT